MRHILVSVVLASTAVAACDEEFVVDGSTKDSYERSIRAMADSLGDDEKDIFARGLINMVLTEYPAARGLSTFQLMMMAEEASNAAHITMDGKTLEEIMERGRSIDDNSQSPEADADGETSNEDPNEAVRLCLQENVLVTNANVETNSSWGEYLSMEITNGLDWPISGIRIEYQVFSEGRSVPWIDDDLTTQISGGIEPGETRRLSDRLSLSSHAPDALTAIVQVVDVADQYERQLIRDVRVIGWADEASEKVCR